MATQYQTWLQSLGTLRADMPVAVRGLPINHEVSYPGDVTGAVLAGSVKASPDAPSELAVFTVGTPSFAGGRTTWQVELSGSQTLALPADGDGSGVETFIYDFVLSIAGSPSRIFGGLFPLSGFVTEPA